MPKAGTYTALQRLQPITEDFGDIAKADEQNQFRYREEKRKAQEKGQAIKDNISKDFKQDYDTLLDVVTKTKSIDEAYARGINSARDLMGETYRGLKNDPALLDDVDTQLKIQNLTKYSKNLKTISDRYTDYATTVSKGMQDGTLSGWNDDTLRDLDSIFRNANLDVRADPKTGLPIGVVAEQDADGNTTGKLKKLNLVEILDGRGLQNTVPTFDLQKSVEDIGTNLGKRSSKVQRGFVTEETQSFEGIEAEVRNMVKGFIGNKDNPSPIAKSIWSDALSEDKKELDDADLKRIEDFYVTSIKGFYDEKYVKDVDQSGALAARKFADDRREKDFITPNIVVNPDSGIVETVTRGGKEGYAVSFGDKALETVGTASSRESIKNIVVLKDGSIVADVIKEKKIIGDPPINKATGLPDLQAWTLQGKGWKTFDTQEKVLTNTDFTNLAKNKKIVDEDGNRFKDGKALKDFLKQQKEALPKLSSEKKKPSAFKAATTKKSR